MSRKRVSKAWKLNYPTHSMDNRYVVPKLMNSSDCFFTYFCPSLASSWILLVPTQMRFQRVLSIIIDHFMVHTLSCKPYRLASFMGCVMETTMGLKTLLVLKQSKQNHWDDAEGNWQFTASEMRTPFRTALSVFLSPDDDIILSELVGYWKQALSFSMVLSLSVVLSGVICWSVW